MRMRFGHGFLDGVFGIGGVFNGALDFLIQGGPWVFRPTFIGRRFFLWPPRHGMGAGGKRGLPMVGGWERPRIVPPRRWVWVPPSWDGCRRKTSLADGWERPRIVPPRRWVWVPPSWDGCRRKTSLADGWERPRIVPPRRWVWVPPSWDGCRRKTSLADGLERPRIVPPRRWVWVPPSWDGCRRKTSLADGLERPRGGDAAAGGGCRQDLFLRGFIFKGGDFFL